jgi:ABC-type branched-subunit amino acid transport system substrate-binding protein
VRNIKNYKGVTGSIQFDNKGDPLKAKYFVLQYDKQVYPGKVVKIIERQAPAAAKKS